MTATHHIRGSTWRHVAAVAAFLVLGAGLVIIALLQDSSLRSWSKVLYDFGFGALLATAVSAVLALYLRRLEVAAEAQAKELEHRAAEQARVLEEQRIKEALERERAWQRIEGELTSLERGLDRALVEGKIGQVGLAVVELGALVEDVHGDIMGLREKVDPQWVHPHQPYRDELMRLLKEQIAHERSAAGRPEPD